MSFLFENLRVYQLALQINREIFEKLDKAKRGHSSLLDQLRRAAMSIPANIAEGSGRRHTADRNQFFLIARGSTNECIPLLEIACSIGLISLMEGQALKNNLEIIAKMLTALIASNRMQKGVNRQ